ncbi:Transposase [Cordylochernes scorpioides]|uniref:Transposase n=1 Tax=Cordylochernes scorpioides TaxID=51811 RepID=A0ABY6KS66_9ARAC|nr:Transposase [Cordylochernes scorpioides]
MERHRCLEDSLKWRDIGRIAAGQSQAEVARWLETSRKVVLNLWKQFQQTGDISRREGQGRPRITTSSEERYLKLTAKRNKTMTARQLRIELSSATVTIISRQTVYRRLNARGMYARWRKVWIPLTAIQKRARLNWCRQHHQESRFSLNTDSGRVLIWRETGTRNHSSNIRERDRYGGQSVMVWGGIMLYARTPLHVFESGTLTSQWYRDEILEPYVRPRYQSKVEERGVDSSGPRCHVAGAKNSIPVWGRTESGYICGEEKTWRLTSGRVDDPTRRCQERLTSERPTSRLDMYSVERNASQKNVHGPKDSSDREVEDKSHCCIPSVKKPLGPKIGRRGTVCSTLTRANSPKRSLAPGNRSTAVGDSHTSPRTEIDYSAIYWLWL